MKGIKDCYVLNNNVQIPCIAFGTYKAAEGKTTQVIRTAIDAGYRYFDTASFYGTESYLGEAIKDSKIPREDFLLHPRFGKMKWGMRTQKQHLGQLWSDWGLTIWIYI